MCIKNVLLIVLGWTFTTHSQTIAPSPKIGTVLWTKTVTNSYQGAFYLTEDERSVVINNTRDNSLFNPVSIDLSTQGFGTLGDSNRLAGRLVTLSDGGVVSQPNRDNLYSIIRMGIVGWSVQLGLAWNTPVPSKFLATKRNTLIGVIRTGSEVGSGEERLLEINGIDGICRSNKIGNWPPKKLWGGPAGFTPSGAAIIFSEAQVINDKYCRNALYLADSESLRIGRIISWNSLWEVLTPPIGSTYGSVVTTTDGLIVVSVLKYPGGSETAAGLVLIDPEGVRAQRIIELPFGDLMVTGMAVGRDGYIYCSLSNLHEAQIGPQLRGGLARVNLVSGEATLFGNVVNAVDAPPIITKSGVLLVASRAAYVLGGPPRSVTVHAIATGSVGGLAPTSWPRSTGDNFDSYREQSVEDSDGDGILDEEERKLGTDPLKTDTDGDSYSDLVEVSNGSNPTSATDLPEILEAKMAIKLTFGTNTGHRYQLQSSLDLESWIDSGSPFDGTGNKQSQLVDADQISRFWRLKRLD